MFYHQATDTHIREGVPFTLNGVQYPANWLNLASPADKAELGLTECIVVGQREDDRYFYVSEELVGNEIRIINTPKPQEQVMQVLQADYLAAVEAHYDSVAHQRRYDNRYTCALRAGYAGPFQAEGAAFAAWMDSCNVILYQMLAEVQAGTRAIPTKDEVLAALPAIVWPN